MIKKIELKKFKKVSDFVTDLGSINVIVGANNAGKSSVLQGIHFTIMAEVVRRQQGRNINTIPQDWLLYLPCSDFIELRNDTPYTNYSGDTSELILWEDSDEENITEPVIIKLSKGRNFRNISVDSSGGAIKFRNILFSRSNLFSAYSPGLSGISLNEKYVAPAVLMNAAASGEANLYLRNILYQIKQNDKLGELNTYIGAIFRDCSISVSYDSASEIYISVFVNLDGHSTPLELCGTGMLQVIQIMAYTLYFNPKLLLLDEPDEHLHPDNQILLCNAIRTLVEHSDLQVIMTTHSRHMIAEMEDDANFIWMKRGEVSKEKISLNYYNVLVDLGALDSFDQILNGKYKRIIFTEDSNTKYLKVLLEAAGYRADDILIKSYDSCSRIEEIAYLASFIKESAKDCKIIVHVDRDFMTDNELDYVTRNVKKADIKVWVTDGSDVESYFVNPAHIAILTGKTKEETAAPLQSDSRRQSVPRCFRTDTVKNWN